AAAGDATQVGKEVLFDVRRIDAFPTDTQVERQTGSDLPIVLQVGTCIRGAEVKGVKAGFARSGIDIALQKILKAGKARKCNRSAVCHHPPLLKVVEAVELPPVDLAAKAQSVFAQG